MKAKTLPGSQAASPIGLLEASSFPAIALVEGGPDILAAVHLAWCAGVEDHIAVVAMLGASNRIPEDVLRHFAGKRVRIFQHDDDAGRNAGALWAAQLIAAASTWMAIRSLDCPERMAHRKGPKRFCARSPGPMGGTTGDHRGSLLLRARRAATGFWRCGGQGVPDRGKGGIAGLWQGFSNIRGTGRRQRSGLPRGGSRVLPCGVGPVSTYCGATGR